MINAGLIGCRRPMNWREGSRVAPRYSACEIWRMMVTFLLKREKGREINLGRKKDNIFNFRNVEL